MSNRFALFFLVSAAASLQAAVPKEWKYSQQVQIAHSGVVRLVIPMETAAVAQPTLGDLRVLDPAGEELAYLLGREGATSDTWRALGSLNMSIETGRTLVTGTIPLGVQGCTINAIRLETPASEFLKGVSVDGSRDQLRWTPLVQGKPIFRQTDGTQNTLVELPAGEWLQLRIRIDDRATAPIPLTSIAVHSPAAEPQHIEELTPEVLDKTSDSRQTTVRLRFPEPNVYVEALRIEVAEPFFRRHASLLRREIQSGRFLEIPLADGTVFRMTLDGRDLSENLRIPVGQALVDQEMTLRIYNGDNPPLTLGAIDAEIVPATLTFYALEPGVYALAVGNPQAPRKSYDLSYFKEQIDSGRFETGLLGPLVNNPSFEAAEPLPQVGEEGAPLDTTRWPYRKLVILGASKVHRLELDLQVLSRIGNALQRLRLVRGERQVPFVVDYPGVTRVVAFPIEPYTSEPRVSRWRVVLPYKSLPITRLRFSVPGPLLDRQARILEKRTTPRGDIQKIVLSSARWQRTPDATVQDFSMALSPSPQETELFLEVDNGDNLPLQVTHVEAEYMAPQIFFKASASEPVALYYGFEKAFPPEYDLSAIASELRSSQPVAARLGPEEALSVIPWWQAPAPKGVLRFVLWGVLVAVVVILLGIIARLLREEDLPVEEPKEDVKNLENERPI